MLALQGEQQLNVSMCVPPVEGLRPAHSHSQLPSFVTILGALEQITSHEILLSMKVPTGAEVVVE